MSGTMTLDELGKEFGVTRERVRQIELKALGKVLVGLKRCYGYSDDELRSHLIDMSNRATDMTKPGVDRHGYAGIGQVTGRKGSNSFGRYGKPKLRLGGDVDIVPIGNFDPTWSDLDSFGVLDTMVRMEEGV